MSNARNKANLTPVLGTAVASTSGTTIDFTGIPSWAKRVTILFNAVSTNGSANIRIQLGTASGLESSGYYALCSYVGMVPGAGTSSTSGFDTSGDAGASTARTGSIVLNSIGSGNIWVLSGGFAHGTAVYNYTMYGNKALAAALDRIRITTTNGTDTFDAGVINILYE